MPWVRRTVDGAPPASEQPSAAAEAVDDDMSSIMGGRPRGSFLSNRSTRQQALNSTSGSGDAAVTAPPPTTAKPPPGPAGQTSGENTATGHYGVLPGIPQAEAAFKAAETESDGASAAAGSGSGGGDALDVVGSPSQRKRTKNSGEVQESSFFSRAASRLRGGHHGTKRTRGKHESAFFTMMEDSAEESVGDENDDSTPDDAANPSGSSTPQQEGEEAADEPESVGSADSSPSVRRFRKPSAGRRASDWTMAAVNIEDFAQDSILGAESISPEVEPSDQQSGGGHEPKAKLTEAVSKTTDSGMQVGGGLVFAAPKASSRASMSVTAGGIDEVQVLRAEKATLEKRCERLQQDAEKASALRDENQLLLERVQQLEQVVSTMKKERLELVGRLASFGTPGVPSPTASDQASELSSSSPSAQMRTQVSKKYGGNVVSIKNSANRASNLEPEPEDGILFGEHDGRWKIKAGTVTRLVEKLYTPSEAHSVAEYVPVFLLTYRSFMSSDDLLKTLVAEYTATLDPESPAGDSAKKGPEEKVKRARICNFIKQWVEKYFFDFENDQELVEAVVAFTENIEKTMNRAQDAQIATKKLATMLDTALQRQLTGMTKAIEFKFDSPSPATNIGVPPHKWSALVQQHRLGEGPRGDAASIKAGYELSPELVIAPSVMNDIFHVVEPVEIARQLTLVEFDLYKAIAPKELLNLNWMEDDKEERAPNVLVMIRWFNNISGWVSAR
jgi:RasGEF N-terminal motif/RasGEF domain